MRRGRREEEGGCLVSPVKNDVMAVKFWNLKIWNFFSVNPSGCHRHCALYVEFNIIIDPWVDRQGGGRKDRYIYSIYTDVQR